MQPSLSLAAAKSKLFSDSDSSATHSANIQRTSVTCAMLKPLISRALSFEQLRNMERMSVTAAVWNPVTSRASSAEQ